MTDQQEDELLSDLQDTWRDLADALGWKHTEGVAYEKTNGNNEKLIAAAKQRIQDLISVL